MSDPYSQLKKAITENFPGVEKFSLDFSLRFSNWALLMGDDSSVENVRN